MVRPFHLPNGQAAGDLLRKFCERKFNKHIPFAQKFAAKTKVYR
jgi:hypothetical protein